MTTNIDAKARLKADEAFRPLAQGAHNAMQWLLEIIEGQGFAKEDAYAIANYYIKKKIAKQDPIHQRYKFAHGGFLEKDVMQRALSEAKKGN